MNVIRALSAIICAYDLVLVPVIVFRRTHGRRVLWADLFFVIGIDVLLGTEIFSSLYGTETWKRPIVLICAILIALSTRYLSKNPDK